MVRAAIKADSLLCQAFFNGGRRRVEIEGQVFHRMQQLAAVTAFLQGVIMAFEVLAVDGEAAIAQVGLQVDKITQGFLDR